MKTSIAGLLCGVLLFAGAAQAIAPQTPKKSFEQIAPYLQDPVDQFPFQSLQKWQAVAADKVAVWSTADDAYLLTVETPCAQLQTATDLGLTPQTAGIVMRQSDSVTAGSDRCRILEIEPIDTERMEGRPKKSADPA
ncbi:DUF6491 family protein [Dokdonella sp.]|uniref:DUF6491 family protein n=1 Tax=Dokdonella sp. TaxID=2291710 RepID=UPI001B279B21|nr:DUF6491 family protein [Dokdonella sp.]MBO9664941.1 hypothetical protein [Dokdonella sp.]